MLAIDNLNSDTAEVIFAVGAIIALIAAVLYALAARPVVDGARTSVAVWAPALLALAVGAIALGFWVA